MKLTAFSKQGILTELHATGKLLAHSSGSLLLTELICTIVIKGTYFNIQSKANVGFFSNFLQDNLKHFKVLNVRTGPQRTGV